MNRWCRSVLLVQVVCPVADREHQIRDRCQNETSHRRLKRDLEMLFSLFGGLSKFRAYTVAHRESLRDRSPSLFRVQDGQDGSLVVIGTPKAASDLSHSGLSRHQPTQRSAEQKFNVTS